MYWAWDTDDELEAYEGPSRSKVRGSIFDEGVGLETGVSVLDMAALSEFSIAGLIYRL